MKELLRQVTPPGVKRAVARVRLKKQQRHFAAKTLEDTFTEIYEKQLWGTGTGPFCSGSGSSGEVVREYVEVVRDLIAKSGSRRVVDLGCGDFQVGKDLIRSDGSNPAPDYIGCDIVDPLIRSHQARFGRPGVEFVRLDITKDELPTGDICLVRQVLQHLSNAEVAAVLPRLSAYPIVVVTEHFPDPGTGFVPNLDKPHGPDTRLDVGSALDLAAAPFRLPVVELLSVPAGSPGDHRSPSSSGVIRTFLVDVANAR